MKEPNPAMKDVTLLISSFERVPSLERLLASIPATIGPVATIVADDSIGNPAMPYYDWVTYLHCRYDTGLSAKRNMMVREAKTDFVVILDDDFEFTRGTRLDKMRRLFDQFERVGIVAGRVMDRRRRERPYQGRLEVRGEEGQKTVILRRPIPGDAFQHEGTILTWCDFTTNFFMARREVLLDNPWDDALKVAEHLPFFLDLHEKNAEAIDSGEESWQILYNPDAWVAHWPTRRYPGYRFMRMRGPEYLRRAFIKRGIETLVRLDNQVIRRDHLARRGEAAAAMTKRYAR